MPMSAHRGDQENAMLSSLPLHQYHKICSLYLGRDHELEITQDVRLGAIILSLEEKNEIAHIPTVAVDDMDWNLLGPAVVMENGWTRCVSCLSLTSISTSFLFEA